MKTILVTGGAGFIGSHLCEKLLEMDYKVINIDNFNNVYSSEIKVDNTMKACSSSNYSLMQGDILDVRFLNSVFKGSDIKAVIHLAALAGVRKSLETPGDYIDTDIKGTVNMLEMCRQHGVRKFIFASSSSVYGTTNVPFREDDDTDCALSPYAAAKRSGELFCSMYNKIYGISCICLRFFTVYGPRQRPDMAIHKFAALLDQGKNISIYGNGKSSRDYTYITDVISGIIAALEINAEFEAINIGSSSPVSLNNVIRLLEQEFDRPFQKEFLPRQRTEVEHTYADLTKAERLLHYSPAVRFEEGIKRFADWYKSNPPT